MQNTSRPRLQSVQIDGVSTPRRSVVVSAGHAARAPTILVHGIFDNVRRWITSEEARHHRLTLAEPRPALPMFELEAERKGVASIPRLWEGTGLLHRLWERQFPAVAFSYQDTKAPVANMREAVAILHLVADWTSREWGASHVNLVGHSRGGLVCRHALLRDSRVMTADRFRTLANGLTAIVTPHRGSRLAEVVRPMNEALATLRTVTASLRRLLHVRGPQLSGGWDAFCELVTNLGQLTPDCEEVREAATAELPRLRAGYFAIAGDVAAYFRCDLPVTGRVRLPPSLPIPELTDGEGDMAVSVQSALDIPGRSAGNTRVLPVNHLTASFDSRVHDTVFEWLGE